MGTLYIVGAPVDDPEDMTLRALRTLDQAALIVADGSTDMTHIGRLLAHDGIATPLAMPLERGPSASIAHILDALQAGDVALLTLGLPPAPSALCHDLVRAARDHGFPVAPIPGPNLPVTALLLSGLPAESFRYFGELPRQTHARRVLLSSVAAERRTLVLLASSGTLSKIVPDLADTLGERPLAMMWTAGRDAGDLWRGTIGGVPEDHLSRLEPAQAVLIVGGAREQTSHWDEQHLRAQIQVRREQGLGAKEISQQLAGKSGWSRRQIYRMAAEIGRFRQGE